MARRDLAAPDRSTIQSATRKTRLPTATMNVPAKAMLIPMGLACALIDPGANQSDLFGRQRFCRRAAAAHLWSIWAAAVVIRRASGRRTIRAASRSARPAATLRRRVPVIVRPWWTITESAGRRPARTSWSAAATWSALGRHGDVIFHLSHRDYQAACPAIAWHHDFAVLATCKEPFQAIHPQVTSPLSGAVATNAGSLKNRANVIGKSDALFVGHGRQFAEVELVDVPLVLGFKRIAEQGHAKQNNWICTFHYGHLYLNSAQIAR